VADQRDELALVDVEVDAGEGGELAIFGVEHHRGVFDLDIGLHVFSFLGARI